MPDVEPGTPEAIDLRVPWVGKLSRLELEGPGPFRRLGAEPGGSVVFQPAGTLDEANDCLLHPCDAPSLEEGDVLLNLFEMLVLVQRNRVVVHLM